MRHEENSIKTSVAMRYMQRVLYAPLLYMALAGLSCATAEDTSPYSSALLIAEKTHIQSGEPFTLGIKISLDEGWHTYWRNPGDAGQPASVVWTLPDGFSAGEILWPFPHIVEESTVVSYGYENEVLLLIDMVPNNEISSGESVTLEGDVRWLVCSNICLPATATVRLRVRIRDESPSIDEEWISHFSEARSRLPIETTGLVTRAWADSAGYVLDVLSPSLSSQTIEDVHFFVYDRDILVHGAQEISQIPDQGFRLILNRSPYADQRAERLEGVLVFPENLPISDDGTKAISIDVPVVSGTPPPL